MGLCPKPCQELPLLDQANDLNMNLVHLRLSAGAERLASGFLRALVPLSGFWAEPNLSLKTLKSPLLWGWPRNTLYLIFIINTKKGEIK